MEKLTVKAARLERPLPKWLQLQDILEKAKDSNREKKKMSGC